MKKHTSIPVRNLDIEGGRALVKKNIPVQIDPVGGVEIINGKINKHKLPAQIVEMRNIKIKKLKVKKNRGEKRKLPEKSDPKKYKRKKNEEKSGLGINNVNEEAKEIDILPTEINASSTPQCKLEVKQESTAGENDSNIENSERFAKQKTSRKSKAIENKCRETLDTLLRLGFEVLNSMDKSLKLIKSLSLLNNKYISIDILLDLISLALEITKENNTTEVTDSEKELSLLMIITKCINELRLTPKRSKAMQNFTTATTFSSQNKSVQKEVSLIAVSSEEVLESQTSKNQDKEETFELCETVESAEDPEKNPESTVEKSGSNFCITKYFKKLKKNVEERDKNERFSCFTAKTDMFLAPKLGGELTGERRQKFEKEFSCQNYELNYIAEHIRKYKRHKKFRSIKRENTETQSNAEVAKELFPHDAIEKSVRNFSSYATGTLEVIKPDAIARKRVSLIRIDKPKVEPVEAICRTKAKLFQFHDNRRPPYWGTWRRKSESVGPRRPFVKEKLFNYEIDSDDEWEEEEEPGESLHGSDDEKEPEEDYEVDNEFFVPHGYLSDDENPEKENMSPKIKLNLLEEQFTSEQKQKMRKMAPIVFGTFWVHKGLSPEGNLYQDLQIDKLQYVPWTTVPVEIEEEDYKKNESSPDQGELTVQVKKYKRKVFPIDEIPNLIKMIHGSPQNCDHLARKFLLYWEAEKITNGNRPGLTKVCVQKKIKELATWQTSHEKGKMCWQVPKETREEFGTEVESKQKPQKCFIWKFVRKAQKNPLPGVRNPPAPIPALEPDVMISES